LAENGVYRQGGNKPSIWFHAVSVGEINAVEALIKKAKKKFPEYNIAITTTTRTGQQVANSKLKKYRRYNHIFSL